MTLVPAGALLGLLGGLGCLVVAGRIRVIRAPRLQARVAPYVRDRAQGSRLLEPAPAGWRGGAPRPSSGSATAWLSVLAHAALTQGVRRLDSVLGGRASLRRRIELLGEGSVEQVRIDQVVWGCAAVAGVLVLGVLKAATGGSVPAVPWFLLTLVAGMAGVLARDRVLSRRVAARRARILAEFPTISELLALTVAAGEGPVGALDRVGTLCGGELGGELRRTLAEARSGSGLVKALQHFADRSGEAVVRRFVDGVVVAVERGTPLADVLRAQAIDVRESGRRELIETAARKEVAMMVPVVFLVLPLSVVFALFPGFYGLSLAVT